MKLQKGTLLLSEPFLNDPNFVRTVILLCDYNQNGAFGFVLNKPTQFMLQDVLEDIGSDEINLFLGGPVERNTLHYIHRLGNQIDGSMHVSDDLFWGGSYEQLKQHINLHQIDKHDTRFFLGYSGWEEGQLEEEIKEKVWITAPADVNLMFNTPPENLWREILLRLGGRYKELANYPIDPRLN